MACRMLLPRVAIFLSFAAMASLGTVASAADYPDHPIRVIVSVPAGGGVDTVTRMVTDRMRPALGQPLVVENKSGVSGSLAAETVFKADPDGYTLLASQPAPITTNAVLYKSLNYVPAELVPVAIMSHVPNVVLVRKDFPAKTVQELIAYAKANPGKINYGNRRANDPSLMTRLRRYVNPRRHGPHEQEQQNGDCEPIRKKHGTAPRRRPCQSYLRKLRLYSC